MAGDSDHPCGGRTHWPDAGLVIGKIGVPAFVTTLACEFIFRGLLTLVTEASGTIPVTDEVFNSLSNGFLPE